MNIRGGWITVFLVVVLVLSPSVFAVTKYHKVDNVNLSFGNNDEVFIDTSNNRVGIGTSSPGSTLHVAGNIVSDGSFYQAVYGTDDGLIFYMPMSETGDTQYDRGPNGYDGTVISTTCDSAKGKYGNGCDFDGTDDCITLGGVDVIGGLTAMTVSMWVNADSTSNENLMANPATVDTYIRLNSGKARFIAGFTTGGITLDSTSTINTDQWYHLTFVLDSAGMKIYIDGELDNSNSNTGTLYSILNGWGFGIGARTGPTTCSDTYFDGSIDEVKVYDRALSQDEIIAQYLGGLTANGVIKADKFRVVNTTGDVLFTVNRSSVGIGTDSPEGDFHLKDADGQVHLYMDGYQIGSDDTIVSYYFKNNGQDVGSFRMVRDSNDLYSKFQINTRGSDGRQARMVVDKDGYVGIGTTSPTRELELVHDETLSNAFFMKNTNSGSDATSLIWFGNDETDYIGQFIVGSSTFDNSGMTQVANGTAFRNIGGGGLHLMTDKQNITFITGGITPAFERMKIGWDGNVGIGTKNPETDYRLDVASAQPKALQLTNTDGSEDIFMRFENGDGGKGLIGYDHSKTAFKITAGDDFGGNDHVTILSDGKVGIGTPSPGGELHVKSATSAHNDLIIDTTTDDYAAGLYFAEAGTSKSGIIHYGDATDGVEGGLQFLTGGISAASNTRMIIESDGDVGIGTMTPEGILHLNKSSGASVQLIETNDDTSVAYTELSAGDASWRYHAYGASFGDPWSGAFTIYDKTAQQHRVLIDSSGNVGIGTTDPDSGSKLHVAGVINLDDDQAIAWGGGSARPAIVGSNTGDYLVMYTVGEERLRVDSSGQVGINAVSMKSNLQVNDDGNLGGIYINGSGSNAGIWINNSGPGGNSYYLMTTNNNHGWGGGRFGIFNPTGSPVFVINSSVIGIGTSDPGDLIGGGTVPGRILHLQDDSTYAQFVISSPLAPIIKMETSDGSTTSGKRVAATQYASNDWKFLFRDETDDTVAQDNVLVLQNDGDVGIGMDDPEAKLDIETTSSGPHSLLALNAPFAAGNNMSIDFRAESAGTHYNISRIKLVQGGSNDYDLAFFTHGGTLTEAMRIDKDGQVGIGTTGPDAPLHVMVSDASKTPVSGNLAAVFEENDNTFIEVLTPSDKSGGILFSDGADYGDIRYDHTANKLSLAAGGSAALYIDSSQRVGIGTDSPGTKLDVNGQTTFRGDTFISTGERYYTGPDTNNGYITRGDNDAQTWYVNDLHKLISPAGQGDVLIWFTRTDAVTGASQGIGDFQWRATGTGSENVVGGIILESDDDGTIANYVPTLMKFQTSPGSGLGAATGLAIDRNQQVGIGTEDPDTKLHLEATGDVYFTMESNSGSTSEEVAVKYNNFATGTDHWWTGLNEGDDYTIAYGSIFNDAATKMVIRDGGNVGIGTVSPSEKLDITGDLEIEGDDGWDGAGDLAILRFGTAGDDNGIVSRYGTSSPGGMYFNVFQSGGGGQAGDNSLDAMYIEAVSGDVGINTTSPDAALHVIGNTMIGATADASDFSNAKVIFSESDTGYTSTSSAGLLVESSAGASYGTNAVMGVAETSGSNTANALFGRALVDNTADTGMARAVFAASTDTHAGGDNIAVWADASGGSNSYSFYGTAGDIYNAGDVGIGTTSPNDALEIKGSGDKFVRIHSDDSNKAGVRLWREPGGGSYQMDARSGGDFQIGYSTDDFGTVIERMAIDGATGDVDISNNLVVGGNFTVFGDFVRINVTEAQHNGSILTASDSEYDIGSSGTRWANVYADTLDGDLSCTDCVSATDLADTLSLDAVLAITGQDVNIDSNTLYVDESANEVGIGTNDPEAKLHVKGSTTSVGLKFENTASGEAVVDIDIAPSSTAGLFFGESGTRRAGVVYTDTNADLEFRVGAGIGTAYRRMIIDSVGNIGINTTSPNLYGNGISTTIKTSNYPSLELYTDSDDVIANQVMGRIGFFAGTTPVRNAEISTRSVDTNENTAALVFRTANGGSLSEQMRIDNNGKVGIGTENPHDNQLAVTTVGGAGRLLINGTATGNSGYSELWISGDTGATDTQDFRLQAVGGSHGTMAHKFSIYDQTDEVHRFTIDTDGNVGVGTTSPGEELHIQTDDATVTDPWDGAAIKITNEDDSIDSSANIQFEHSSATDGSGKYIPAVIASYKNADATARTNNLGFYVSDTDNVVNADQRMAISSDGNVGIGTGSPVAQLDVNVSNNEKVGVQVLTDTGGIIKLKADGSYGGVLQVLGSDASTVSGQIASHGTHYTYFGMTHNVGIGDNSPDEKFDVNGDAAIYGGLCVDNADDCTAPADGTINADDFVCNSAGCIGTNEVDEGSLVHDSLSGAGTVDTSGEVQGVSVGGEVSGTVGNIALSCTGCVGGTEADESTIVHDSLSGAGTVDTIAEWQSSCSGCVEDADIDAGAVDGGAGGEIADNTITADDIAADAVGDSELFNGGDWIITSSLNIGTADDALSISIDGYLSDEDDSVTINDALSVTGDAVFSGTTPQLTMGDAGAEDTHILFDGNAQDYYIALDDSEDDLVIGNGATVGTTPAVTVASDGKVSVGPAAPTGALDVTAAGGTQFHIMSTNGGDYRNYGMRISYVADGDFGIMQSNAANGNPTTAGTTRLYIDPSGDVGIGTTSPGAQLDVEGTDVAGSVSGAQFEISTDDTSGNANTGAGMRFELYNNGVKYGGAHIQALKENSGNDRDTALRFVTRNTDGSHYERLRITGDGNVGIGTTTPLDNVGTASGDFSSFSQGLHIEDTSTIGNLVVEGNQAGQLILADSGAGDNEKILQIKTDGGVTTFGSLEDDLSGLHIYSMVLDHSTGNIGIGTLTNPIGQDLVVDGDMNVTGDFYAGTGSVVFMVNDTTNNVGVGTRAPSAKLEIFHTNITSLLSLGSSTGGSWGLFGGDGTGWGSVDSYGAASAITIHEGDMYVGLGQPSGRDEVWKWDGSSWTQIGGDGLNGGWDTAYDQLLSFASYHNKLYLGTGHSTSDADVWEWDGISWTQIGGDGLNSAWSGTSYYRVEAMIVYENNLYAGLYGNTRGDAELWKWDGSSWSKIGGDGTGWADSDFYGVISLEVYDDKLYAGLGKESGDAELYAYDGSSWSFVAGDGTGWSDTSLDAVSSLEVFNGKLYVGLEEPNTDTAEVWEYDGSAWVKIASEDNWGSASYDAVYSLKSANGRLYIGLGQVDTDIYEWDGAKVRLVGEDGTDYTMHPATRVRDFVIYDNKLYAAMQAYSGDDDGQVWEYDFGNITVLARNGDNGISIGSTIYMGDMGYLGIGTDMPEAKLDVEGDFIVNDDDLVVEWGNVGIGTTEPGQELVVIGDVNISDDLYFVNGGTILFANSTESDAGKISLDSSTDGIVFSVNDDTIMRVDAKEILATEEQRFTPLFRKEGSLPLQLDDVHVSEEYAYAVKRNDDELYIIDIHDKTNPVIQGTYSSGTYINGPKSLDVAGKYAYIVSDISDSLTVLDVSDAESPTLTGYYSDSDHLSAASFIKVAGKYAYVTNTEKLVIFDISDPTNPRNISLYEDGTHLSVINGLDVSGDYAYICSRVDDYLVIVDVEDPYNPTLADSYQFGDDCDDVDVVGGLAYVVADDKVNIMNVSDPTDISLVGTSSSNLYQELAVAGDHVFVGRQFGGLDIIDVSDPESPSTVFSDSSNDLYDAADIEIAGKYLYSASESAAIFAIASIGGIDAPGANIGSLHSTSVFASKDVDVGNNLNVGNSINVGPGGIMSDGDASFGGYNVIVREVTTTGAGTTTIEGLSMPTNAALFVDLIVTYKETSTTDRGMYRMNGLFTRESGAITSVVTDVYTATESDAGADATMAADGNDEVDVNIDSTAGTHNWKAVIKYYYLND